MQGARSVWKCRNLELLVTNSHDEKKTKLLNSVKYYEY